VSASDLTAIIEKTYPEYTDGYKEIIGGLFKTSRQSILSINPNSIKSIIGNERIWKDPVTFISAPTKRYSFIWCNNGHGREHSGDDIISDLKQTKQA